MTAFDRIERRLPELIDDLASASVPDYFDDMLQQTTRSRQRPSWSSLERWLPMGVIARPLPVRPIPWRLIAVAAILVVLAAATLAYVGSRRVAPPPFGLARNGALLIGTADGDIVAVDPDTGKTTPIIGGPTIDGGPFFSNDGQRFVFDRRASPSGAAALYIANVDGSGVHELFPDDSNISSFEWSPGSDRALITRTGDAKGTISIVDLADGKAMNLTLDLDVTAASWRPNHDQIVVTANLDRADSVTNSTFWVVNLDGSGTPRQIPASGYAINTPTISPDGTKLAYATWEPSPGSIRMVDIDTGGDRPLTTNEYQTYLWQNPWFSPDGTKVLVYQFIQNTDPGVAQLAAIDVGSGAVHTIGPVSPNPQPNFLYSPDGTKIVADYPALKQTWIFDADGGNGHPASFSAIAGSGETWQRLAP